MSPNAYLNRVATAVPRYEVHRFFLGFAASMLAGDPRQRSISAEWLTELASHAAIPVSNPPTIPTARRSTPPACFQRGAFPDPGKRMDLFAEAAPVLAQKAVDRLVLGEDRGDHPPYRHHLHRPRFAGHRSRDHRALRPVASVERTIVGFMGCYAAVNALKLAHHIVRSEPEARVIWQSMSSSARCISRKPPTSSELLTFILWGDGCAAALITAEPTGLALDSFRAVVAPDSRELMTWTVRNDGFDMVLSGQVPARSTKR